MDTQHINMLALISSRFEAQRVATKNAQSALREARDMMFDSALSYEEWRTIAMAIDLLGAVADKSHQQNAIDAFNEAVSNNR